MKYYRSGISILFEKILKTRLMFVYILREKTILSQTRMRHVSTSVNVKPGQNSY